MRRLAPLLMVGLAGLAGVALLVIVSATQKDTLAFTLGVPSNAAVAPLKARQTVCQAPIAVPDDAAAFDRVAVHLGTYRRPGPPITLTVRTTDGRVVANGRLAGGYADNARPSIAVGRVAERGPLRVCLHNVGPGATAIYGAADAASRTSTAQLDGEPLDADLDLVFERDKERSVASLIPAIVDRAALFRVSWIGSWTYVLLGILLVAAIPALLAVALRNAVSDEGAG